MRRISPKKIQAPIWLLATGLLVYAAPAPAQFEPQFNPQLQIQRAPGEIEIDGELNDAGWSGAARASGFSESWPNEQAEPSVGTTTWVTYDDQNLYLAFLAQDDPALVRATLTDRDNIWQDDYVGIILDTYGTGNWAYEVFLNPLGIQGDLRWTTNGEDMRYDMVFESKGRLTDDGWQVEVAIPFKSLRFPDTADQSWRATFWRNHPRDSRSRYSWAAMSRDEPCWPCQFGTLTGIQGVSSGQQLDFLPSFVGGQSQSIVDENDPDSGMTPGEGDTSFGFGVRYAFSSSFSGAGTYNPDFSQVESDAAQIDVNTTFALGFPERRPFFQEGSDLWDTWIDQTYTRNINAPEWAAKITGRLTRDATAILAAQDDESPLIIPFEEFSEGAAIGRSYSFWGRAKRAFWDDSYVGFLGTHREYDVGGSGSSLSADARVRFFENYRLETQFVGSYTHEPNAPWLTPGLVEEGVTFDDGRYTGALDGEAYPGFATYASIERDARTWNADIDYWGYSPTFRADSGLVTQNAIHRTSFWTGLNFYPGTAALDQWQPSVNMGRIFNWNGVRKDEWLRPAIHMTLKLQTSMQIAYLWSNELFRGTQFDGIRRAQIDLNSNFSQRMTFGFFYQYGRVIARNIETPVLGTGYDLSLWSTLKPFQRLEISASMDFSRLSYPDGGPLIFNGYVARVRSNLQLSRPLFVRLILQYNDFAKRWSVEPLITYKVNPFTAFYLGSTHDYSELQRHDPLDNPIGPPRTVETQRQIFFKIQYLFRS